MNKIHEVGLNVLLVCFSSSTPVSGFSYLGYQNCNSVTTTDSLQFGSPACDLGPLPENWERAFTSNGEPYFIEYAIQFLIFNCLMLLMQFQLAYVYAKVVIEIKYVWYLRHMFIY